MKNRFGLFSGFLILALLLSQGACTMRRVASNVTSKIFVNGASVLESKEDVALSEQSIVPMIYMLEVMRADNPKNRDLNVLLARSYGTYAYSFFEQKLIELADKKESADYALAQKRAVTFYEKGRDYGLSALKENAGMAKALESNLDTFKKALASYNSKSDVPLLYWTAFNWANSINFHKDSPLAVAAVGKVEAMMAQCLKLDPSYFYGGIHQFFGAFYASRPTLLGGDLNKAKDHFEKAIAAGGGRFLMAKVAYAQFYGIAAQDKALFESLLREVIAGDPAALPEERLANEVAQLRAKALLHHAALYF